MSNWRQWWHWWLAASPPLRRPSTDAASEAESSEGIATAQATAILGHATAAHPLNRTRSAEAARRLQQQLGNHAVQRLLEDKGQPVPANVRSSLGSQLADDFSDVRLHTGETGAAIARSLNAEAVTIGKDIALGADAYAPDTLKGRQLLAHELAHTVQAGTGDAADASRLEMQARSGDRPTPGSAGLGQVLCDEKKSWRTRVQLAQAETNEFKRRQALIALVTEALVGYALHIVADKPASGPVSTQQYKPAPAINFDFYLEQKEYWPAAGRKGKLGPRSGYFFSDGSIGVAIIGPGAVEANAPALTRMAADHELFHASHHIGNAAFNDQELEAWTDAFVHYFHEVYRARKSWQPLIDYYQGASAAARTAALQALTNYYKAQPEEIQRAFWAWLRRRKADMADRQLVQDLIAALPAPLLRKPPTQGPPSSPPPPR